MQKKLELFTRSAGNEQNQLRGCKKKHYSSTTSAKSGYVYSTDSGHSAHPPVSSKTMKSEETMSSSNAVMIMETIGKQPYLLQPTTKPVFLDIKKPHVKIKKPYTMNEPSFPK